jgi:hypothetical protein
MRSRRAAATIASASAPARRVSDAPLHERAYGIGSERIVINRQGGRVSHGGHTCNGVAIRVLQRILALTAVIWHNDKIGGPIKRSLIAYDH